MIMPKIVPIKKIILIFITSLFLSCSFADGLASQHAQNPTYNNLTTCVATNILTCFSSINGLKLWENTTINDARGLILNNGHLYLTQDNTVKIFQAQNGTLLNSIEQADALFDPVITAKHLILTSLQGQVSVWNLSTHELIWKRKLNGGWIYPPVITGDQLLTGGQSGTLWSINLNSGQINWQQKLPNELVYQPIIASNILVVSTFDGVTRGIDPQTGRPLWETHLNTALTQLKSHPPGQVLSSGYDGKLYALNSFSGELIWESQASSSSRFNYASNAKHSVSIDHQGVFKLFDHRNGKLLTELKIEGNHQVAPLITNSSIWIFPDGKPAIQLNINTKESNRPSNTNTYGGNRYAKK